MNHQLTILITGIPLALLAMTANAGTYSGGAGTAEDPYRISAAADWQELTMTSGDWDDQFILTADLDLTGVNLTPVGNINILFAGIVDGNGHVIRNAVINLPNNDLVALFGYTLNDSQIQNLGVENIAIVGRGAVGGLCGQNLGSITNCNVTGNINGEGSIGGLCGGNSGGISQCSATSKVMASGDKVGGLVGGNYSNGTITSCDAAGTVTGKGNYVGGLMGINIGDTVSNCRAEGSVLGKEYVGGIVGFSWGSSVSACRFDGQVRGDKSVGGLVGYSAGGVTFQDCIFQGMVTGNSEIGGIAGTSEELSQLKRCYSTGRVRGGTSVGGITGGNHNSMIEDSGSLCDVFGEGFRGGLVGVSDKGASVARSYSAGFVSGGLSSGGLIGSGNGNAISSFWDIQTSGQPTSVGGQGKSTSEMKSAALFLAAGWDFVGESANGTADLWKIREGLSYPRFASLPESPYDFAGDFGVGFEEFAAVAHHWLAADCSPDNGWCAGADLNHSGSVDLADLLILGGHWMEGY